MTLPFGIKTPDVIESGHATSAPEKPMLGQKLPSQLLLRRFYLSLFIGLLIQALFH